MNGFKELSAMLLGGSIGDAVGAPFKYRDVASIADFYPSGLVDKYCAYFSHQGGQISSNSQMTLFTLEGITNALKSVDPSKIDNFDPFIKIAYSNWLLTQGHDNQFCNPSESALVRDTKLCSVRQPSQTCVDALSAMHPDIGHLSPQNAAKGCGALTRMSPIGMLGHRLSWPTTKTFRLAENCAFLTHNDPVTASACGAYAVLVQYLCDGLCVEDSVSAIMRDFGTLSYHQDAMRPLELARKLALGVIYPEYAFHSLTNENTATSSLALAVYTTINCESFEKAMYMAIAHNGNSPAVSSIVGTLWVASKGIEGISREFIETNELGDYTFKLAADLVSLTE